MTIPRVIPHLFAAAEKLRVKSALNPALWLCGIITMPIILLSFFLHLTLPTWLVILIFLPVACAFFGFFYLLFFNPDKLQSEDYQIRKQSLELIQQKGDLIPMSVTSIQAISNPETPRLTDAREAD